MRGSQAVSLWGKNLDERKASKYALPQKTFLEENSTRNIEETLRELGVVGTLRGRRRLIEAVRLALEDENRLLGIIKEIYMPAAEACGVSWKSLERCIRTIIDRLWQMNRPGLDRVAGYQLFAKPTVSEFIAMLAEYIRLPEKKSPRK